MGQSDRHSYKATSVRFPLGLKLRLKAEAERAGRSVSSIVIEAVAEKLDHAAIAPSQAGSSSDTPADIC